ncbi:DUF1631 family protein [Marinobacter sp. X15-166B]|uniref:DUF1631 family protein n=1 Tax=Marinobacter sp. X15-166B TaxID=1897620 RepID=UPI00085CA92E|nr:DUF1631 family protein [Marinobacter sp. X15-166B]OEY65736.1 diguanylate cyclase [Marinobacter sp. X15-166B]
MESKDRRASVRQPIELEALIGLHEQRLFPCQITDFCAEGLFIQYPRETEQQLAVALEHHDGTPLRVSFRTAAQQAPYELDVRVARRVAGAIGVAFARPNTAAIAAMLQLCGAEGGVGKSALTPPDDRVQFVLHQCAKTIVQHLEPLMAQCLTAMVSALEEAAQRATSDQQAADYMDSSGQLKVRGKLIWQQMAATLESPLKPARKPIPEIELSLVEKNEFEDWLTIRVMVTKADTLYRGDLLKLKLRLDKLGVNNTTGHQNPLGPALICDAFHAGLGHLQPSRNVAKVCLKTFETDVLLHLEPLFHELNQILIRQGVLPDLDLSRYLSQRNLQKDKEKTESPEPGTTAEEAAPPPQSTTPSRRAEPAPPPPPPEATPAARFDRYSQAAQSAFATVSNLLDTLAASRAAAGDAPSPEFPADATPLSAGELQRELQQLQTEPVAEADTVTLKERVVSKIKANPEQRLDDEHHSTVDVVDRFFNSVNASPRLSAVAQRQLRHLEVPVLKVVIRDPGFFDDSDSPVRGVMNRIAQLSAKDARENPVLQRRVDELIERIVNDFEQDTAVFEKAVTELDVLVERQQRIYRRNVERVTAAAEGAQKVADSKAAVATELDRRLAGRRVPKAVVSLLNAGWRDLLSLTWIRQGPDSELWLDYLTVIDSLLAFGDDPQVELDLAALLVLIQNGLASISSNNMPPAPIRDELKAFLVRTAPEQVETVEVPPSRPAEAEERSAATAREQRSLQRWCKRARQLRTGDWLRDQQNPDQPQYMRLVWIAREFSRFVFVNHQGMRVVEHPLNELARQMRAGIIVPDSHYDQPLVDASIDHMVRKAYDQLSWASTHDDLTRLLGRREFERTLEQQLSRHEDERVLVRLDLRQFRLLNDTAGYQAGDDMLKAVAETLRDQVPDGMPIARLGGNEFGFLLPAEDAQRAVADVIHTVEAMAPEYEGRRYRLSASAGVAPMLPALTSAERWLRASESACKDAKQLGNGRVVVYSLTEGDQARQEQITQKVATLGGLDDERMLLRCQKIIPLHAKTLMSAQLEILISMYDDAGTLITGRDFIRMAERYNRIQAVDRWVVGHMLDWLRAQEGGPNEAYGVCINLSGYSLNDESLLEFIHARLSENHAPLDRLWFEITETAAINDLPGVAGFIAEMKAQGCRFCLGNFGSGPTSFEYMRTLPVDLIKLDGAFVRQLDSSDTDRAMVRSMVDMAHYMGREVIATQVESREVLDVLTQLGVDYAQGFAIERPRQLSTLG